MVTDSTRRLVRELVEHRTKQRSSIFEIVSGDLTTFFVVIHGDVVSVRASKAGEPLGRILVRRGLLRQEQYVDVLGRMSAALAVGEKMRFGEVAVELGYVDEEGVRQCLGEQLRLLASRAFQTVPLTWTTRPIEVGRDTTNDIRMPAEALFLDAIRWVDDSYKATLALDEARGSALQAAWEVTDIDGFFELTPQESAFVRIALAGDRTVTDILADVRTPDAVDTHAIVTALLATGAAISTAAGAGRRLAPSLRPAGPMRSRPSAEWAIDATAAKSVLAKIVLAKLSVAPPPDDKFRALEQQLRSEQSFQRGKELLRVGRTEDAAVELKKAISLKSNSAEYALFEAWARHASISDALSQGAQEELRSLAHAAIRENSTLAFGSFVLGELCRTTGEQNEANRLFRHALRLDPPFFAGIRIKRFAILRSDPPHASRPGLQATSARPGQPTSLEGIHVSATNKPPVRESRPATPHVEPTVLPKRRHTTFASIALLVALSGIAIGWGRHRIVAALNGAPAARVPAQASTPATPRPPPVQAATQTLIPAASHAPVVTAAPSTTSVSASPAKGSTTTPSADPAPAIDPRKGVILLPQSAKDHRVYIDGRLTEMADLRITTTCGIRDVRIGSQGRTVKVDVPCGAETAALRH